MRNKVMTLIVVGLVSGVTAQTFAQMDMDTHGLEAQAKQETQEASDQWEAKHKEMKEKWAKMKADCQADVQKFCASSAQGRDRMQCLIQNKSQLSSACATDVSKAQEFHKKHADMKDKSNPDTTTY